MRALPIAALLALLVLAAACDYPRSQPSGGDDAPAFDADPNAPDADPTRPDADPTAIDASAIDAEPGGCTPGATQCTNCIDDDADGELDGDDLECTSASDNDEGSFETGIPMSNIGDQDCYFDDNGGGGDDGCAYPRCCSDGSCAGDSCLEPQPAACNAFCGPITVPGCDCFGCCTVCGIDGTCVDVSFDPSRSSSCTYGNLGDGTNCATCTKYNGCGVPCGAAQCILCHGQTDADLAPECGGQRTCPAGLGVCTTSGDCGVNQWCGNGCCVAVLQ